MTDVNKLQGEVFREDDSEGIVMMESGLAERQGKCEPKSKGIHAHNNQKLVLWTFTDYSAVRSLMEDIGAEPQSLEIQENPDRVSVKPLSNINDGLLNEAMAGKSSEKGNDKSGEYRIYLHMFHLVRCLLLHQLQISSRGSVLTEQPPIYPPSDVPETYVQLMFKSKTGHCIETCLVQLMSLSLLK